MNSSFDAVNKVCSNEIYPWELKRSSDLETTWHSFYMALNSFITNKEKGLAKKEDKQVGQFFIDFEDSICVNSHSTVNATADVANEIVNKMIRNKLLIYLWQDVQGVSSFGVGASLFDKGINCYDDLYTKFGNDKVFSDTFINDFLKPVLTTFPY